ncbi:HMG box-containing protein 4 isoform X2 [Formica exsecta]|uniref:HMG box-containing protein 4 isoform X2 n=1 Tax=Formica exsecta TaxID=72781 RepID=UPI0011415497|nr:HMG box-containing protein 4 isoform X2 [Formica exsecta]
MNMNIREPAKSDDSTPRRSARVQASRWRRDAMDMYGPSKPRTQKSDEVTGISRSGRVRKKSSKLVDFESPDDLTENKLKRQKAQQLQTQQLLDQYEVQQQQQQQILPTQSSQSHQIVGRQRKNSGSNHVQQRIKVESLSDNEIQSSGSESDDPSGINEDERYSMDSGSDNEVDPLMIDDRETGFRKLEPPSGQETPSQANSLYMLEKCKKKLIIKDGKIIGKTKAQRKDKGKTRFTAYMLWAKKIRQELLEQSPYMDFAAISKRLGELWATVPHLEKYNWRRRAKRLAAKPHTLPASKDEPIWKMPPPASRKKFINKIGNGKETKTTTKKTIQLGVPSVVGNIPISPPSNRTGKDLVNEPVIGTGMYKVIGTQPIDVAAHLKLLGESLTIIGERLKEHDGQIAVSGSLSVLLDSLLCALGPLICLTQQLPETNGAKPETLSSMLDNIAYLMPGL